MKKKNIILLIIAIVMFILVGSTMAYFGWSSSAENKDQLVDVTVSSGTGSCDKYQDNEKLLVPTSTRERGRIIKVKAKQQMATNAFITWNLVINSINESTLTTSGLKHSSFKYELVNDTTGASYGTGNFENVSVGTTITFSTDKETLDYNKEYIFILYLWIDGTIGNNPLDMTNQPYDFDLNCSITGTDKKINKITTSLDNFTYFLGSDTSTVDTIEYYNNEDDNYYDIAIAPITLQSNEILLTKYNGTSKNVVVPDTYTVGDTTYNVVVLSWVYLYYYDETNDIEIDSDDGVFEYNTNIESVFLGNNVKFIYNDGGEVIENSMQGLFTLCTSLVNVPKIPSSVTNMDSTFSGCTSLVNAPEIPSSVTNMSYTFYGCSSLVNAPEIPSSVTNMSYTFYGCTSLVNVSVISSSVTDMSSTFNSCTSLVNAPVIPSSVTNMSYTFRGCTSLVNAPEIPSSVTNMYDTFYGCTSLVNAPTIPSSVTNMSYTFRGCTSLVNAPEISDSVTNMYDTFYGCTSLVNAPVIPSSVTNMDSTFSGCTSLVNAPEIPSSVTNMSYTFYGCSSLVNAPEIPSSVTNMSYTFYGCTSLVNVPVISSSVTNMNYTFYNCTSLVNAPEIPSSVTSMAWTFRYCTNLTGIVKINSSNVSNTTGLFSGTSKSITVQVPSGSTTYTTLRTYGWSNVTLTTY